MLLDSIDPVRESLKEVAVNLWTIADHLFLYRQSVQPPDCTSWKDGHGGFFVLSDAKPPTLESLSPIPPIPLVYDVGDSHAVWEMGDAFFKVLIPLSPDTTREHVTLEALHRMNFSFTLPKVLYHGEWNERYYLVVSKIPGQTLSKAWPHMSETRRDQCVDRVVSVCKELSATHAEQITGIDGNHVPEQWLADNSPRGPSGTPPKYEFDFRPETFLKNCREVEGMDCSLPFQFYHCDLGPGNIIVDFVADQVVVGVIDWECAGYFPRHWIRTKFRMCSSMDLPEGDTSDWRARMQRKLGEESFPEVAEAWMVWRGIA